MKKLAMIFLLVGVMGNAQPITLEGEIVITPPTVTEVKKDQGGVPLPPPATTPLATPAAAPASGATKKTYTVKSGDYLIKIKQALTRRPPVFQ